MLNVRLALYKFNDDQAESRRPKDSCSSYLKTGIVLRTIFRTYQSKRAEHG